MTDQRLEIVKLVRRIHIGQHPLAAKHRDVFPVDHVYLQVFKQVQHLQSALNEASDDRRMAGSSVDRAQGMISAFGPRHDSIHGVAQCQKAFEKSGRDERHVTRNQDDAIVASSGESRVETAQWTAVRDAIGYRPEPGDIFDWTAADEQDIVGDMAQLIELTLENSSSPDTQGAFVAAAEAARLTAGENRGASHSVAILPPA